MRAEDITFWLSVALVAIVAVITFKLLAARFGEQVPALGKLGAFA